MNLAAQVVSQPSPALKDSVLTVSKKDSVLTSTTGKQTKIQDASKVCTTPVKGKNHGTKFFWQNQKKKNPNNFDGHWGAFELGFNGFNKPDYSMYNDNEFMKLNQGKSIEWTFNFSQINIGLYKSYIGLVSGLGLSFNDYKFQSPYTLVLGSQRTEPVLLDSKDLSLTKLWMDYLQVPLLLEFQVPVNLHKDKFFISAGVVGGVKISSYTKVKYGRTKDKDHSGFNINPFEYEVAARIGLNKVGLFGTYSMTPLFESGKGPKLIPFTLGFSIYFD